MSMITKCPSCGTTFRVTPPQLQVQQGRVRCGRCALVFDGFKTLATLRDDSALEPEPPAGTPDRAEPEIARASPQQPANAVAPARMFDGIAPTIAGPSREPEIAVAAALDRAERFADDTPPQAATQLSPQPADELQRAAPHSKADARAQIRSDAGAETHATFTADSYPVESMPKRRRAGWAFGILALLIALGAQAVYFYRGEIASGFPELQPHLNRMCDYLRCTVALPQRPRQISIEASDMQAPDPAVPGLIALTATLRNHAPTVVGYPALDVVLTNAKEHTVARRIFLPAEYLDPGTDPRVGIQANAEVTVKLNLDSGELGAAGFRLDLLAAPAR